MNITQAIESAVEIFRSANELKPSHCDVRCLINDLTSHNPKIVANGYDQDRAWQRVRKALGNPVKLSDSPYASERGWTK